MCLALDLFLSREFDVSQYSATVIQFGRSILFTGSNRRSRGIFVVVSVVHPLCGRTHTMSGRSKTGRIKTRRTTTRRTQPCRRAAERTNAWCSYDFFICHCPCSLLPFCISYNTKTCNPPPTDWRVFLVIYIVMQRVQV